MLNITLMITLMRSLNKCLENTLMYFDNESKILMHFFTSKTRAQKIKIFQKVYKVLKTHFFCLF